MFNVGVRNGYDFGGGGSGKRVIDGGPCIKGGFGGVEGQSCNISGGVAVIVVVETKKE
jgi:hypothetical protein